MENNELLTLLQFAGGLFPTGAFSQSWGLETYIFDGIIDGEAPFRAFLNTYLEETLSGLEGPFFCHSYELAKAGKFAELAEDNRKLTSMKLTKESREGSLRTGKAFLRVAADILENETINEYYAGCRGRGITFPVAFALTAAAMDINKEAALNAFIWSAVSGLVQSAVKLIPLGNSQAQKILLDYREAVCEAAVKAAATPVSEAFAFCPAFDIASMRHENLPTRLYMS